MSVDRDAVMMERIPRTLQMRLIAMAAGWCCVGIVYSLSAFFTRGGVMLPETFLDRWIAFSADTSGVLVYLSFFVLVPFAYLATEQRNVWRLMLATQFCALVSGAVFLAFPTAVPQDAANIATHTPLLTLVQWVDTPRNCFPSLHASQSLLSALALSDRRRPLRSAAIWLWTLCILWSVVRTRRHFSLDIAGGAVVAFSAWLLAARLISSLSRGEKK